MAYTHQDSIASATIDPTTLPPLALPAGVTSRFVNTTPYSLHFHILESLPSPLPPNPKLILCIHGFPELAFSWRHVLPLLSSQGYHAVAFDQRGYGRTFSPSPLPLSSFRPMNLISDAVALVRALGYTSVSCVVGHDFGALTAALCALARPDMFKSAALMSHPTKGAPFLPLSSSPSFGTPSSPLPKSVDMEDELSRLPRPRKHYKWYYCTPPANDEMTNPTGPPLHTFLRGYFHLKSADWDGNAPHKLSGWTATELAKMPRYYVMDRDADMRENVRRDMVGEDDKVKERSARWLNDDELQVYVEEWGRVSFQGGLNWYGMQTRPDVLADLSVWSGTNIRVPTVFVSGQRDWGTFQEPGAVESMENGRSVAPGFYRGTVIVDGAGHWVNQEQPARCVQEIMKLVKEVEGGGESEKGKL